MKRGFSVTRGISVTAMGGRCNGWQGHSCKQGVSPVPVRAGALAWQRSSVPIEASLSLFESHGSEGGATTLIAIARRTTSACHLMGATIGKTDSAVNVKFKFEDGEQKRRSS
jgi:hypothetical protein